MSPFDVVDEATSPFDIADEATSPFDVVDEATRPFDIADEATSPFDVVDEVARYNPQALCSFALSSQKACRSNCFLRIDRQNWKKRYQSQPSAAEN